MAIDWTPIIAGVVGAGAVIAGTALTARTQLRALRLEHAEARRRDDDRDRQDAIVTVLSGADEMMSRARGCMVKGAQLTGATDQVRAFVSAQSRLELVVDEATFAEMTPYIECVTYYLNLVQAPSIDTRRMAQAKLVDLDLLDGDNVDRVRAKFLAAARRPDA